MKYSKSYLNDEINNYINIITDLIYNDFIKNNRKMSFDVDNFDDLIDKYLDKLIKDGFIDKIFPVNKTFNFLDNKWKNENENTNFPLKYYKGGCETCMSGSCLSCSNNKNKNKNINGKYNISKNKMFHLNNNNDLNYLVCKKKFCFSYHSNLTFPIAKIGRNLIYLNSITHDNSCEGQMLKNNNNTFELLPNLNVNREVIYISGPSGSGKTYFAKQYGIRYLKLFKNREIYVFSIKNKDKSLDGLKYNKIFIDDKFEKFKVNYQMFKNSLVIFDDIENLGDVNIRNILMKLSERLINLGRDLNISIIMISHIIMNYKFTKHILGESNRIVIFPYSGYNYYPYFKEYLGYTKKKYQNIMKLNSRWLVIFKQCPLMILSENKFFILSNDLNEL